MDIRTPVERETPSSKYHYATIKNKCALIEKDDVAQEICFKKSIQAANKLLQQHDSSNNRFQLIPIIETIDGDDSFEATRKDYYQDNMNMSMRTKIEELFTAS
ncbi:unnamed protein product [Trichobilharzia regenti]|nr:unnamed protein product [Trichobilharzia regenti]